MAGNKFWYMQIYNALSPDEVATVNSIAEDLLELLEYNLSIMILIKIQNKILVFFEEI